MPVGRWTVERLMEAGFKALVGSVEDSYGNAMVESINSLYKSEVIYKDSRCWCSLEEVELATLKWIDWFNNRRLLESIGDIPPAEYEQMFYHSPESCKAV